MQVRNKPGKTLIMEVDWPEAFFFEPKEIVAQTHTVYTNYVPGFE